MRADARLSGSGRNARRGSFPVYSARADTDDAHLAHIDGGLDPLSKWDKKVWFVTEGLTKSFQSRFAGSKRLPRIVGEITRRVIDRDNDGFVTSPFTGRDEVPFTEMVDFLRDKPELMRRLSERINERLTSTIGSAGKRRRGTRPLSTTRRRREMSPGELLVSFLSAQSDMVFGKEGKPGDSVLKTLSERDMGFTISPTSGKFVEKGYAVARPGRGLRIPASAFYDENNDPTDVGIDALVAVIAANISDISKPQDGARSVAIGGWHSPKRHDAEGRLLDEYGLPVDDPRNAAECEPDDRECITFVYLDITDVFDEDEFDDEKIYEIGRKRNQQSVARLSAISSGNYSSINATELKEKEGKWAFLDTEGTGMDVLDEDVVREVAEEIVGAAEDEQ